MFFVFLISLPALAMPMNRGWLKLQGWLVVSSAVFTLIIGLFIWFSTLQVRKNLGVVYAMQSSNVQGLMQTRVWIGLLQRYGDHKLTRNSSPVVASTTVRLQCS